MIDTHCHIHDDEFPLDADKVLQDALEGGVEAVICVGTDAKYSEQAVEFAKNHEPAFASVGLHPHDAARSDDMAEIANLANAEKVVAIGECGLDYYYENSPKEIQQEVLRMHFKIARENSLPMIFHIRGKEPDSADAYKDFWAIYDDYKTAGVVHSFSAHERQLEQILERKLYLGVNGIVTFAKPGPQLEAFKKIPLASMVLETDSPLLTPKPYRGRINEPKYTSTIQSFLAQIRGETTEQIREITSSNAVHLFGIDMMPHKP